jgi:hypothetical protein
VTHDDADETRDPEDCEKPHRHPPERSGPGGVCLSIPELE